MPARFFNPQRAARLLWRAGFGGTWDEATELADLGLDEAVNRLVEFTPHPDLPAPSCAALPTLTDAEFRDSLTTLDEDDRRRFANERQRAERENIDSLKDWWLGRMVAAGIAPSAPPPLEEKLTLFWHGHFASGFPDKIERTHPLWQQNQTLRAQATAPFPDLVRRVLRDPAMLVWLDNANSRRGNPNENLARELMELFTTGVGPYTEDDVKESARALTGNSVDRDAWAFEFHEKHHDEAEKTFFGQSGNFRDDDIARILCEQPATAHFIAGKLLDFFVVSHPDPDLVTSAADFYRYRDYDLRELLHVLFRSQIFHADENAQSVVKSPVVLAVGALKAMRQPLPESQLLLGPLRVMGQDLFFPPDVNGWPGGADWINSNTLLIRYNFANFLLNGISPDEFKTYGENMAGSQRRDFIESQRTAKAIDWSPRQQLEETGADRRLLTATDIVDHYAQEFLQRPAPPELRRALLAFAETDAAGGRRTMSLNDSNFDERARGIVHLIMSSPDYQLC
jgi:uncharacterized protein (DUF1800 family)